MRGITKKIVSVILAIALTITGISYTPGTAVQAAGTITTNAYTAEISDGKTTFGNTETIKQVKYNNYIRYGATIAGKSGEDTDKTEVAKGAAGAIDNDASTRWAHASSADSGFITVDLGAAYSTKMVYINWEVANAKRYKIQYSHNGTDFTDAVTIESSGTELAYAGNRIDKITLTNEMKARYVKIQVLERCAKSANDSSKHGGVSIWEIGIYGTSAKSVGTMYECDQYSNDDKNADGKVVGWKIAFGATDDKPYNEKTLYNYLSYKKYRTATASGNGVNASHAIDGNVNTRWMNEDNTKNGQYITVNLGAEYNIAKLCISWETAKARTYNIETSNDGVHFDTAATVRWEDSKWSDRYRVDKVTLKTAVKAQYVRIYTLTRANDAFGASIWEMGIYGTDDEVGDHVYTTEAFDGYADTIGNYIEGENYSDDISYATKKDTGNSQHGGGNLAGTIAGSIAGYRVHFDRKTSKVKFRYSGNSVSGGKIKMYVDGTSGNPVATITTSSTGSEWKNYTDTTADVVIPCGDHKIYLVMEPDEGKQFVANVDYFQFEYAPEDVDIEHEGENAHAYEVGSENFKHTVEDIGNGKFGIGSMNTDAEKDPAYLTTYVSVDYSGKFLFKVKYSTTTATNIEYRINDGNWTKISVDAGSSASDIKEKIVTEALQLNKGINKIDITGARDTTLSPDGWVNDWLNVDSFILQQATYDKTAFVERNRNSETLGNRIEAEEADAYDTKLTMENGKLGHNVSDTWAQYNVYFDRKTSGIQFHYSRPSGMSDGTIEVYVDSMEGVPAGKIVNPEDTGSWGTYKDVKADITVPSGRHKIYLKFVTNDTNNGFADIDYFQFDYTPQNIDDKDQNNKNEAEDAHAYTQGTAEEAAKIENHENFSGGTAIKNMNAWPSGRSYLTTYIYVEYPGTYTLTVGYAAGNDKTTNIDYRINTKEWTSLTAKPTGGWYTVNKLTTEVNLEKGINIVDITGASNIQYEEANAWQQANIDYFRLDRIVDETNIAYRKPTESGKVQTGLTADKAVDESTDKGSRWAADNKENWMIIDLKGMYEIEEIDILFEVAYGTDFEILFSRDKETWVTTRTVRNFNNGETIEGSSSNSIHWNSISTPGEGNPNKGCLGKTRYIKINISKCGKRKDGKDYENASIWEFVVRGEKVPGSISDLALSGTATASSSETTNTPSHAIDGKNTTRWASPNKDANPYLTVDLGRACELSSVDLTFERAYAKSFRIQVSDDGETWTDAATVSGWTEPGDENTIKDSAYEGKVLSYSLHLNKVKASYVRFYTDERINTDWGVSVFEFEVWGKDLSKSDYWSGWSASKYGIYPVDKLYNNTTASDGTSMGDTSIVQENVIANEDTYEVVYEPGKKIYFYINPYGQLIDLDKEQVCWSAADSGVNQWGANHSESIAKCGEQRDATIQYILPENIDFGSEDYVTTEIACQVWTKTDLQDGVPIDGKSPKVNIKFKLKVLKSHDIYISDTIRTDGCLNVRNPEENAQYVWQRSADRFNWEPVNEKRYDLTIVNDNGKSVNVAMDLGGGKYYRVKKTDTTEWSQPYFVPFYNNVQNGDFEFPAMHAPGEEGANFPFNGNGDEQQYPNGYPGLIWKTTAPGWKNDRNGIRVGHDIEIVNGRNLRVNEANQVSQFSVTLDQMYGDGSHGDQFAELNAENVGALYQDILTTPGSECYWDLDHAGRWSQNSMYVVAMSSQNALQYTTKDQVEKIVNIAKGKNLSDTGATDYSTQTEIELESGIMAYVWRVVSPETKGIWAHHSGKYLVPTGPENYLTRFFFVSEEGSTDSSGNKEITVGNLLDNVTFEMKQSYTIEYYVKDENDKDYKLVEKATEKGMVSPYDRVGINNLNYSDDNVNLNTYTLTKAEMNETPYYMDDSGLMTVAYNHNSLKLYYDAATIAVTKKVEGIREIPEGYTIEFALVDTLGNTWGTTTLGKGAFSKVEQNGDEAEGYFATIRFQATKLGITDNTVLKIQEKLTPLVTETNSYLEKVKIDDEVNSLSTDLYGNNTEKVQYEKQFTYRTGASNSISFVNIYKSIHTVSITKEVVSKYLNVEIGNDDTFQFTLNVQKNNKPISAFSVGEGITESSDTGKYTFALKDNEKVELSVLDGCTVTVEEDDYAKAYYTTAWSGTGADLSVDGRKVTINTVDSDTALICTNKNIYYGDVEVQGFQMNTDNSVGGVSEFSPSFRVVSRACKMLQGSDGELYKVTAYGTIYSSDENVRDNYNEKMRLENAGDSDYVYGTGEFNSNIYYYETKVGTYLNWTTRQPDDPYYNYFALTFSRTSYSYPWLDTDMTFRAYARLENGEVVYGTKVYTVDIFEIAENLYQNTKLGTKEAHEFLYTNVLNLMTMSKNRVSICKSMFAALGADITNKTTDEYLRINTVNHDINDYVYCQKDYTYKDRGDFSPNNTDEAELLAMLNTARSTEYDTLSNWIYNETPKLGFAGFYEKVPYDWDNNIYSK